MEDLYHSLESCSDILARPIAEQETQTPNQEFSVLLSHNTSLGGTQKEILQRDQF